MSKNKLYLINGSVLVLLIIAFLVVYNAYQAEKTEKELLYLSLENKESKLSSVKNELLSEKTAIKKLYKENSDLVDELFILKKQKQKIKYIVQTKYTTKIVEKTLKVLPDSYLFLTSYDMPICEYNKNQDETYSFKTLPVEYSVDIINTDKTTSVKVEAKSSYDGKIYSIPLKDIKTESIKIKTKDEYFFRTDLSIGLAVRSDLTLSSSIGASFFHYKNFDFLKFNLLISEDPALAISPVSYNLKDDISIFQDLSIEAGAYRSISNPGVYIGLSTKF